MDVSSSQLDLDLEGNARLNGWEMRLYSITMDQAVDFVRDLRVEGEWRDDCPTASSWLKLGLVSMIME